VIVPVINVSFGLLSVISMGVRESPVHASLDFVAKYQSRTPLPLNVVRILAEVAIEVNPVRSRERE